MVEYTYQVARTADGKYLAICIGFSDLCYIADTEAEAVEGIKRLVNAEAQQKATSETVCEDENQGQQQQ